MATNIRTYTDVYGNIVNADGTMTAGTNPDGSAITLATIATDLTVASGITRNNTDGFIIGQSDSDGTNPGVIAGGTDSDSGIVIIRDETIYLDEYSLACRAANQHWYFFNCTIVIPKPFTTSYNQAPGIGYSWDRFSTTPALHYQTSLADTNFEDITTASLIGCTVYMSGIQGGQIMKLFLTASVDTDILPVPHPGTVSYPLNGNGAPGQSFCFNRGGGDYTNSRFDRRIVQQDRTSNFSFEGTPARAAGVEILRNIIAIQSSEVTLPSLNIGGYSDSFTGLLINLFNLDAPPRLFLPSPLFDPTPNGRITWRGSGGQSLTDHRLILGVRYEPRFFPSITDQENGNGRDEVAIRMDTPIAYGTNANGSFAGINNGTSTGRILRTGTSGFVEATAASIWTPDNRVVANGDIVNALSIPTNVYRRGGGEAITTVDFNFADTNVYNMSLFGTHSDSFTVSSGDWNDATRSFVGDIIDPNDPLLHNADGTRRYADATAILNAVRDEDIGYDTVPSLLDIYAGYKYMNGTVSEIANPVADYPVNHVTDGVWDISNSQVDNLTLGVTGSTGVEVWDGIYIQGLNDRLAINIHDTKASPEGTIDKLICNQLRFVGNYDNLAFSIEVNEALINLPITAEGIEVTANAVGVSGGNTNAPNRFVTSTPQGAIYLSDFSGHWLIESSAGTNNWKTYRDGTLVNALFQLDTTFGSRWAPTALDLIGLVFDNCTMTDNFLFGGVSGTNNIYSNLRFTNGAIAAGTWSGRVTSEPTPVSTGSLILRNAVFSDSTFSANPVTGESIIWRDVREDNFTGSTFTTALNVESTTANDDFSFINCDLQSATSVSLTGTGQTIFDGTTTGTINLTVPTGNVVLRNGADLSNVTMATPGNGRLIVIENSDTDIPPATANLNGWVLDIIYNKVITIPTPQNGWYAITRLGAGATEVSIPVQPTAFSAGDTITYAMNNKDENHPVLEGEGVTVYVKYASNFTTGSVQYYLENAQTFTLTADNDPEIYSVGSAEVSSVLTSAQRNLAADISLSQVASDENGVTTVAANNTECLATITRTGAMAANPLNVAFEETLQIAATVANGEFYFRSWFNNRATTTGTIMSYAQGFLVVVDDTRITFASGNLNAGNFRIQHTLFNLSDPTETGTLALSRSGAAEIIAQPTNLSFIEPSAIRNALDTSNMAKDVEYTAESLRDVSLLKPVPSYTSANDDYPEES